MNNKGFKSKIENKTCYWKNISRSKETFRKTWTRESILEKGCPLAKYVPTGSNRNLCMFLSILSLFYCKKGNNKSNNWSYLFYIVHVLACESSFRAQFFFKQSFLKLSYFRQFQARFSIRTCFQYRARR
jgi:hypothetical protein